MIDIDADSHKMWTADHQRLRIDAIAVGPAQNLTDTNWLLDQKGIRSKRFKHPCESSSLAIRYMLSSLVWDAFCSKFDSHTQTKPILSRFDNDRRRVVFSRFCNCRKN